MLLIIEGEGVHNKVSYSSKVLSSRAEGFTTHLFFLKMVMQDALHPYNTSHNASDARSAVLLVSLVLFNEVTGLIAAV